MSSLAKREKIMLAVLVVIIMLFSYYKLFLTPVLNSISQIRGNIIKYSLEVDRFKKAENVITQQKKELEDLKSRYLDALKLLPRTERNPEIAYRIKQLGDSSKVIVQNISFGEMTETPVPQAYNQRNQNVQNNRQGQQASSPVTQYKLVFIPLSVSSAGDYNSIMNFVNSIETDERTAQIAAIAMTKDAQSGQLTASIGVSYYYSTPTDQGKPEYDFNGGEYGKADPFK